MARVEVITGADRRRRWSDDQKQAIVAASLAPGAMVSAVARRAEVCPSQIYRWRQEFGVAAPGFAQVLIAAPGGSEPPVDSEPVIEVEYAGKVRVRIPASIPANLAAAVVKALSRR